MIGKHGKMKITVQAVAMPKAESFQWSCKGGSRIDSSNLLTNFRAEARAETPR